MRLAPSIKRAVSPLWFFFHSNSLSYIFLFMISRIRLYCSICFSRIQDYCAGKNTLFLGFKELQDVFISIILHVLCSDIGILLRWKMLCCSIGWCQPGLIRIELCVTTGTFIIYISAYIGFNLAVGKVSSGVDTYASLTGLSRTTAGKELRRWYETEGSGIGISGMGTHRVYVLRGGEEKK